VVERLRESSSLPRGRRQRCDDAVLTDLHRLKVKGFDPGPVDGVFGAQTEAAVTAFHRAKWLPADGIVGPKTLAKLRA
jgi:peptidoglycan hydrolase-like protein with peptidoglycan-binding domain